MPLTKEHLIAELDSAHRRIAELEKSKKKHLATPEAYHALVDHSLQGLLIVQDGRIVFTNRRFSEMSGYTVEELLNAPPEKLKAGIHPEDRELVWRRTRERLDGKPVPDRYEYRALRKDGKVFWLETFSALIEYRGKPAVQSASIDITANKLSQEALHTERQKIITTIGLVPYGVVLIDRDGTYRHVNPKFIELFGYDMNEIPNGKEWFRKAFPDPEYRNEVIATWVNDFRNAPPGENKPRTFNVTCKNGKERIVNFIAVLLETGEYILTCSDITEVKQVEAALRESEQKLHSIIQGSPTPAFVIGKNHRVMYWNKALEDITGIRADDVVGTTGQWKAFYDTERPCLADILVDEGARDISQWYREKHKKSTLSEDAHEATDFFPKLGKKGKWLHFTASVIRDSRGDLVGAIETLEDITSYKRIEQEIQESEKRYRTIFENTGTATVVYGEDLIIRMANTESEKLSGYSKKEIEGEK
ncbi:MAG: PAS domain S-box protein, partial [Deltaproteobacteria bacterium]|nr:PAS domain S-box protein [Deltaproteobacteria bacterium]